MKRIALRVVPAVALLVAGLAWVGPRVSGQGYIPSTAGRRSPVGRRFLWF